MVLEKDVFLEYAKVVGVENINDGNVTCQIYAYNWCTEFVNYIENRDPIPFSPVPKAVILPSTTEEVQRVVKLCNKHNIQFKAQSK